MEYADNDTFLVHEQEKYDGMDRDDAYEEKKEQYEQDIAEDKWECMNE